VGFAAIWRRRGLLACLLYPLSIGFYTLATLRRVLYRMGFLPVRCLPVPVVVVGNLTVGGTGKTPLIIHLATSLRARGMRPGIVSRGYRGAAKAVIAVTPQSSPAVVGDEPLLLARRSQCPIYVGHDRVAAGEALLANHPVCDVILADDGLQHYRLARDVEIAVFDERGVMNGWQLPAGPLREPISRLARVDAIVQNGVGAVSPAPTFARPVFSMQLLGDSFYRLDNPQVIRHAEDFTGQTLHAVAGIGFPPRFFSHLQMLGMAFTAHPFADHHVYQREDLLFAGDAILMTEKDAVKFAGLDLPLPVWVLPVTASVEPDLTTFILEKLNGCPPA
jgi:tetraacyldisaccharide 4'-kinase